MRLLLVVLLTACGSRTGLAIDPEVEPSSEDCNGLDDDGDGAVDEGIAELFCGVGACRNVVPGCLGGLVPSCAPFEPQMETCNGEDDDCNGAVDDGLPLELSDGPITVMRGPFSKAMDLVETPEGLLAVMGAASLGPPPNDMIATRTVSFDGELTSELQLFGMRPSEGPTVTPSADGLFHLTVCAPFGSENRLASQLLDAFGNPVGELVRREPTRSCGAAESFSIWTGERHITAWVENSSAPTFEEELLLDVHDADLRSVRSEVLLAEDADLSAQPYFVQNADRVLMVAGRFMRPDFEQLLQTFVFDARGRLEEGPIAHDTPDEFQPIAPRLVRTAGDDALMLVANRFGPGIVRARVGFDGELRTPIELVEDTIGRHSYPDLQPLPDGGSVWVASLNAPDVDGGVLYVFDDDGNIVAEYLHDPPDEGYFGWPSVLPKDGRYYVLYGTNFEEDLFEVRLIVLGCGT